MEMQMDFQQHFLRPELAGTNSSSVTEEEEYMRNKENIPLFSSYSSGSGSVLRLSHPRKPLQDITRLVIRSSPSVAEARARVRLGVRSSSKKCSKKKAAVHLSSAGVVSSEERRQRHEMLILRKSFR